jgi:DNA sulfur modification protein DndB
LIAHIFPWEGRALKQREWQKLEKRAYRLLSKRLQANDAGGGPLCKLSGFQTDAYGIFGKVALVLECKTTARNKRININQAVDKLAGRRPALRRALREKYGKQLKYFRFVIVVGNASAIAPYNRRSKKPRDISVWTPKYFDAVESLASGIGNKAVPYILKELRISNLRASLNEKKPYELLPAIRVSPDGTKNSGTIYSFFAPARSLLDLCYVARVESDQPRAYQRLLNRSRLKKIRKFINGSGTFKNSVVLSIPSKAHFQRRSAARIGTVRGAYGILRIPYVPASMWIIDGQHRIYGFLGANRNRLNAPIPVVGVQNLNNFEQGRIFVDINGNQKPVDVNLLWDLYSQLYSDQPSGVISSMVKEMAFKKASLLYRRIYVPGSSVRSRRYYDIYLANICEAIEKQAILQAAIGLGAKVKLDFLPLPRVQRAASIVRRKLNVLCRSLKVICRQLGERKWWDRFFLSNNGISIVIRLLRELLIFEKIGFDLKELRAALKGPLKRYLEHMDGRIDEVLRNTSSEAGRDNVALDIFAQIRQERDGFAAQKLRAARKFTGDDAFQKIIGNFEKSMREIIRKKLQPGVADWWHERIPPDVQEKAEAAWEKGSRKGERLDRVDMSDYIRIISRNWANCFELDYKQSGIDKNDLSLRFKDLCKLRNHYFHFHGSIIPTEEDIWQARILSKNILQPLSP